jgi:hypothetical protein
MGLAPVKLNQVRRRNCRSCGLLFFDCKRSARRAARSYSPSFAGRLDSTSSTTGISIPWKEFPHEEDPRPSGAPCAALDRGRRAAGRGLALASLLAKLPDRTLVRIGRAGVVRPFSRTAFQASLVSRKIVSRGDPFVSRFALIDLEPAEIVSVHVPLELFNCSARALLRSFQIRHIYRRLVNQVFVANE